MSRHIAITGQEPFLKRYKGLATAMEASGWSVSVIPADNILESQPVRVINALKHRALRTDLVSRYLRAHGRT